MRLPLLATLALVATQFTPLGSAEEQQTYSACDDASWAICTKTLSPILGTDKQLLYDNFIESCKETLQVMKENVKGCAHSEKYRMKMNRDQPESVYNYTEIGYKKIRAPEELYKLMRAFYDENKGKDEIEWSQINTYHNMWASPPTIMHLNRPEFKGGGAKLQTAIWREAKRVLQEWSGQELKPVSLYGIRLYHNDSILAPHVDRMPLVTSAIINVDQDVDEPWPLEVYGHDGKAVNVTMEPGDMVLYESHSVIHGRPFPMRGNFFANAFIHFEAAGPIDPNAETTYDPDLDLPPYLIPGSKWALEWRKTNPDGWKGKIMNAIEAARKGDARTLEQIGKVDSRAFHIRDGNGWTPLHESVRTGCVDCVKLLMNQGIDKDLMTYTGVSPLNIAREFLGENHDLTKFLVGLGAKDRHPSYETDEF